jgi:hypothetical protein
MQAEKAAPAPHLPPRNKEEGGRRIMTTKKQKNGRSRDRLFVYKQTKRPEKKERERERERERESSVASVSTSWRNNQQPSSVGSKTLLGEENCTY